MQTYITKPIASTRTAPTGTPSGTPSGQVSVAGCPGQFVPVSILVRANTAALNLSVSANPGSLPAAAIDIRVIKWWWAGADINTQMLTPELLLHDETLVRLNGAYNEIKLPTGYVEPNAWCQQQQAAGNPRLAPWPYAAFPTPAEFPVEDATSLQPLAIPLGENRELWVLLQIPAGQAAGPYSLRLTLTSGAETATVDINLEVYPFALEETPLEMSCWYQGSMMNWQSSGSISAFQKSELQLRADFQNMKNHGLNNPMVGTIYYDELWEISEFNSYHLIRQEYFTRNRLLNWSLLPRDDDMNLGLIWKLDPLEVDAWCRAAQLAYPTPPDLYLLLGEMDQPADMQSYLANWQSAMAAGAAYGLKGMVASLATGQSGTLGGVCSAYIQGGSLLSGEASAWTGAGKLILSYRAPEVEGLEVPLGFRRAYGLALWQKGYSGAMHQFYQYNFGFVWTDLDHPSKIKDNNLTYPAVSGPIDTLQWEGFREAAYDLRYLATLQKAIADAQAAGRDTSLATGYLTTLKASSVYSLELDTERATMATHIKQLMATAPPLPVAGFTYSPQTGTAPLTVQFTDASQGTITNWAWVFGDGGTSTQQNPSHIYQAAGSYTVTLTVTGPGGTSTPAQATIVVSQIPAPVADFSAYLPSPTDPLTVQFEDLSQGATSWSWQFGDGGTSTQQNPLHTYPAAGDYTVTLTVSGPGGGDTETKVVHISAPTPVAGFIATPSSGPAPLTVQFSDTSTGQISGWSWQFGDAQSSTERSPSHTYTNPGSFTVTLMVTGPGGSSYAQATINVGEPAPQAAFSAAPVSGTVPLTVQFTDASQGTITDWAWAFGDGGTSTQRNPSHIYTTPGNYTARLTVTGPGGSTQAEVPISVAQVGAPVAGFSATPQTGVAPLTVQFTDTSSGVIGSWSWEFGDGGVSNEQHPSHIYQAAGNYTVHLAVTGPGGTTHAYIAILVTQIPAPVASFAASPSSGKAPLSVQFQDLSQGTITSWSWEFGDSGTSTLRNPSHTYTTPGNYTVTLTVTGLGGTSTPATLAITVEEPGEEAGGGIPTWVLATAGVGALGLILVATAGKGGKPGGRARGGAAPGKGIPVYRS